MSDPSLSPADHTATAQPPPLASEPNILERFQQEVSGRGLVGEEPNAKTLYLVLTSRLLSKQVSAGLKGHSSSGKSYTVETVLKFFPRDCYLEFTAMSEKALIYSKDDYRHRTLIIFEVVALREGVEDDQTSYFVRTLLSEGRLSYPVTVRDPDGGWTTKTIIKEGPTNLVFTTTKTRVHAENETRVLSLNTNDSTEQTARIFRELAREEVSKGDLSDWRALQAWLQTAGERRVTIPYAASLAEQVPPVAVRLRRDFAAILSLIRSHAILHQCTRQRDQQGRIIATIEDYRVVRELVADVVAQGVGATVSPTVRDTIAAVSELASDAGVMARQVAEHLHIDKSNATRRLKVAADGGYVRNLETKRGLPHRWVVGDPLPEEVAVMPPPDALSSCAVAPRPEGQRDPEGSCAVAAGPEGQRKPCQDCGEPATSYEVDGTPKCDFCVSWNNEGAA
jgi:hypothetical protein